MIKILNSCTGHICRIVKVDLDFPLAPHVSSEAKDLIGRVS